MAQADCTISPMSRWWCFSRNLICAYCVVAGITTHLLTGPSFAQLTPLAEVLRPGGPGEFDNGYAGLFGAWRDPATGRLTALYHAEDQEDMPLIPSGVPGYYSSIGCAVSDDDGTTFNKLGQALTSQLPKSPEGSSDQGIGEGSLLPDKTGKWLLCYYTDHSKASGRGIGLCVARSPIESAGLPGSWLKYYQGDFTEPGLGGKEELILSGLRFGGAALTPHAQYVAELDRYVMVFCVVVGKELGPGVADKSGIYLSTSADGLKWAPPLQVLKSLVIPWPKREMAFHPTLVVEEASADRLKGRLYYCYSHDFGHEPPASPHYLVARDLEVTGLSLE